MNAAYKTSPNGYPQTTQAIDGTYPEGFTPYVVGEEPQELLDALAAQEAKEAKEAQINEANQYLKDTDWVEAYKLRHDLNLEIIPETSSKWEVLAKREEYKVFLKDNS